MLLTLTILLSINILIFFITLLFSKIWIFRIHTIPKTSYLLVLGAGILKNGRPSKILDDRLLSAATYSNRFDPQTIILSGTRNNNKYNEPASMRDSLLIKGIPLSSIELDLSGNSTFYSCKNFFNKYGKNEVVIISQEFHLFRAVMIGKILGLNAYGLVAENYNYKTIKLCYWYFREFFAIPYNLLRILLHYFQNWLHS